MQSELQAHPISQFWQQKRKWRDHGLPMCTMNLNQLALFWAASPNTKVTLSPRDSESNHSAFSLACCILIWWQRSEKLWPLGNQISHPPNNIKMALTSGMVSTLTAREKEPFRHGFSSLFAIMGDKNQDSDNLWHAFHWNICWNYEWRTMKIQRYKGHENTYAETLTFLTKLDILIAVPLSLNKSFTSNVVMPIIQPPFNTKDEILWCCTIA